MQSVAISVASRKNYGKSSSKSIRKDGQIPVVIYSKDEVTHGSVNYADVKHLVYSPDFKLAEISLEKGVKKCILQDIQTHPVTDNILHIDFLELVPNHPLKAEVPVRPVGTSPGVKLGGKFAQSLRKVKIKCTPENLVDVLTIDISKLKMGNVVRVDEIKLPEGIQMLTGGRIPIASVVVPRALKSSKAGALAVAEEEDDDSESTEESTGESQE